MEFRAGSLFEPVSDIHADVVIGDVSGVPDELGKLAGWFPPGTEAGGPTGAELPIRMVEEVGDCLVPGGRMYLPTGTIQNEEGIMEQAKTGIKMKAEGDMSYEPSLLIEMEKVRCQDGSVGQGMIHRAWVTGDRFDLLTGRSFDNPGFEQFLPHIKQLNRP